MAKFPEELACIVQVLDKVQLFHLCLKSKPNCALAFQLQDLIDTICSGTHEQNERHSYLPFRFCYTEENITRLLTVAGCRQPRKGPMVPSPCRSPCGLPLAAPRKPQRPPEVPQRLAWPRRRTPSRCRRRRHSLRRPPCPASRRRVSAGLRQSHAPVEGPLGVPGTLVCTRTRHATDCGARGNLLPCGGQQQFVGWAPWQ